MSRPTSAIRRLCVIGHPSRLGGADTELDHQIHCWQKMGIEVHVCHTGQIDANLEAMQLKERGCIYHRPRSWKSLEGLDCVVERDTMRRAAREKLERLWGFETSAQSWEHVFAAWARLR